MSDEVSVVTSSFIVQHLSLPLVDSVNGLVALRPSIPGFDGFAGAQRDARQRVFGDVNGDSRFVFQQLIQSA